MRTYRNDGWESARGMGRALALVSTMLLAGAVASQAEMRFWNGEGVNALASNPTNWVGANAPVSGDSIVLNATTNKNMTWNMDIPVQSWTQVGYGGTVTVQTVYPGKGAFTNFTILGDCVISNGMWTHTGNTDTEVNRLRVTVGGDLILGPAARIDVAKKGYAAQYGPGCPPSGTGGSSGHGGLGSVDGTVGSRPGVCYGSVVAPSRLGSGSFNNAAYAGAGAIWMDVTGQAQVDGTLYATSATESGARPGSGGSIYLVAGALRGGGSIQANGGGGYNGAGGGRIALAVTNAGEDFSLFTGQITAYTEAATTGRGGAGTIYLRKAGHGIDEGTLIVDNAGQAGKATEIGSNVTDTAVGDVLIRNSGYLLLQTNQSLTVNGTWSNAATFAAYTGSAVIFGGNAGSTATVYGVNTFVGFICTNGNGKTLLFQAGKTNVLAASGRLRLIGSEAATNLVLRSTVDGTPWRINVAGTVDQSVSYVDVKDSDALLGVGTPVSAVNSLDRGGNSNWVFLTVGGTETNVWTGASNTVWSQKGNWSLARAPTETDFVRIPSAMPRYPVLDDNRSVRGLEVQSGASLELAGFNLLVTAGATVAGALRASGTETITFEADVDFTGGSFRERQSTVLLAGTAAQDVNLADLTFCRIDMLNSADTVTFTDGFAARDLRCAAPSGTRRLTFQAGATFTLRDLVLLGSVATTNIVLRSSSTGTPWHLAVSGYRSVRGVDVQDSDANGGLPIPASSCKNSGNNDNWIFGAVSKMWTPTSGTGFHTAANWTPAGVPDAATRVWIESGAVMTMTGEVTVLNLVVGGGAGGVTGVINGALSVIESVVLLDKGVLQWNKPGLVGHDLVVAEGGLLTHAANTANEANKIDVTVSGDMWLDLNGFVDVVGKGYSSGNGPGIYFGAYGGGSASYGGVGSADYTLGDISKFGLCYGSITAPTNLGSSGVANDSWPGGGAVRLRVAGRAQVDGGITVRSPSIFARPGSGGSVFIHAGAVRGSGTINANGGDSYNGPGGGRISLVATNAGEDFSAFTGTLSAFGGAGSSTGRGGAGTIYRQCAADGQGRGVVTVANNNLSGFHTDVPSAAYGVAGETDHAVFRISDAAKLRLKANVTVGDIWLDTANALLDLGSNTLTVNTRRHPLGLGSVTNYGAIVWRGLAPGSVIVVK